MKQFKYKIGDVVEILKADVEGFEGYDFAGEIVEIVDVDVFHIHEATKELTHFDYKVQSKEGMFGLDVYEEDIKGYA